MEAPDKDENLELPGDKGNEADHSEGYFETHSETNEEKRAEEVPVDEEINQPADVPKSEVEDQEDLALKQTVRRKTILGLSVLVLGLLLFTLGFSWIIHSKIEDGIYSPIRKVLGFNEKVNKKFFKEKHLAPTYPQSAAVAKPKVNGDVGMGTDFDTSEWALNVVNIDKKDTIQLTMADIKKLPKTEICFNFKCIEGWSQVTHWGGVRLIDFINYYKLATHSGKPIDTNKLDDLARYAGFETPDDQYYVGLDIVSALHPQTLLCYEMNGKPLPYNQGAPLRLIVPVKYGIKSLKRIGVIFFSDTRPHDYWFEQGYDYDAAL